MTELLHRFGSFEASENRALHQIKCEFVMLTAREALDGAKEKICRVVGAKIIG